MIAEKIGWRTVTLVVVLVGLIGAIYWLMGFSSSELESFDFDPVPSILPSPLLAATPTPDPFIHAFQKILDKEKVKEYVGHLNPCESNPPYRCSPYFMLIGLAKCGTTSLYSHLAVHPQIEPPKSKELRFFNRLPPKQDMDWYLEQFPKDLLPGKFTFEASPNYFFISNAPVSIARTLPNTKLLLLLRDPVDMAVSFYHYRLSTAKRYESIAESIEASKESLAQCLEGCKQNEKGKKDGKGKDGMIGACGSRRTNLDHKTTDLMQCITILAHTNILVRGLYSEMLRHWYKYFPREQILIIKSEDLWRREQLVMENITDFLGINRHHFRAKIILKKYKVSKYLNPSEKDRADLVEFFKEHTKDLYSLLNVDLGWNSTSDGSVQVDVGSRKINDETVQVGSVPKPLPKQVKPGKPSKKFKSPKRYPIAQPYV